MPAKAIPESVLLERLQAYAASGNRSHVAAKLLNIPPSTMVHTVLVGKKMGLIRERNGKVEALETHPWQPPAKGKVRRYLITSAQDHTKVHMPFWNNLQAMALHYDAELVVSTFMYNKKAFNQSKMEKHALVEPEDPRNFDPVLADYIYNERRDIAPRLTLCGELNILPTARRPLSGLENYTYRKSTIVPHPVLALKSVAGMKSEGVKLLYTTGCCTQRNYIQRKEGFRAEHFHAYAALLVEVNDAGNWWCRHVEQARDGTLCDLALVFKNGKLIKDDSRVANITWGDIHASRLDKQTAEAGWAGAGNMLDALRPYSQHLHDLLDFSPASHHTRKDPFENYRAYMRNDRRSVARELRCTAQVAAELQRPWCRTVAVNSNHDRHLQRYLCEVDWRDDAENAELICALTAAHLRAIRLDDKAFNIIEHAIREHTPIPLDLEFLKEDASDVILRNIDGGIECGLHGDRGANGAKGTPLGISKAGRKINMADKHTAEIVDTVYVAGVSGALDMGYNKGLSSWTHAHIVTYNNGTRTIVSVYDGKWKA
jgi:hypothetical protein